MRDVIAGERIACRLAAVLLLHALQYCDHIGCRIDQRAVEIEQYQAVNRYPVAALVARPPIGHQIIHVEAAPQRVGARDWVVVHANAVEMLQPGIACPGLQLGRPDELLVFMSAGGQQFEHILGTNDGKQKCFRGAIDGREKHMARRV